MAAFGIVGDKAERPDGGAKLPPFRFILMPPAPLLGTRPALLDQRLEALGKHEGRASQLDDLELTVGNEHVECAATDADVATGVRDTHRNGLDAMARITGWLVRLCLMCGHVVCLRCRDR